MANDNKDITAPTETKDRKDLEIRAFPAGEGEEEKESYSPTVHGKVTDSLAVMAGRSLPTNSISNNAKFYFNGVTVDINDVNAIRMMFEVSTHQLLSKGLTEFTKNNHVGSASKQLHTLKVMIPLKEYALLRGYDITEHPKKSEEDQKKEAKRAKAALDNCRKEVRKDLSLLFKAKVSWKEKVRGKVSEFADVSLLGGIGYRNGYIYMEFTQSIGEYLVQLPLTLLPDALYKIDGRNPNVYNIGLKMIEHYNMDSNQRKGTASLLSVKSLLEVTSLPTLEQLGKNNHSHWRDRIKERMENALEALVQYGVLANWGYSHSKGVDLSDEEAENFPDYESWANTLVYYTLKDAPDQTARLEARKQEYEERQEKAKKKKAAKKKKEASETSEEPASEEASTESTTDTE